MRTITSLLPLLLLLPFTSFAQYTSIPDVNFETQLVFFNYDSEGTVDGQILTSDAAAVTTLGFQNQGIVDLTGISAFINLTNIDLSYNTGLTSVDLTGLNLLSTINFTGCSSLTTITLPNSASVTSIIAEQAGLTSLDVSNNTGLTTVNVFDNNLQSLDFSANTALVSVNCKTNALIFLDMRNGNNANVNVFDSDFNPNLDCLFVDDASAAYLSSWIIAGNTTAVNSEAECEALSVDGVDEKSFTMFANANLNAIKVSVQVEEVRLQLFDVSGKQLLVENLGYGENLVDSSFLASGLYFAKVSVDDRVFTKKLLIIN